MTDEVGIERLLDALIEREGGYVDHPADRGGPTRFGITEAVARAHGFRGRMRMLPREEAQAIYRRLYWLRPRFDQVAARAPRIAAELFDTGVNMGHAVAATFLQRALTALNRNGSDFGNYILEKAESVAHKTDDRPALTIEVSEDEFCRAVAAAVSQYFREGDAHTDARYAGPPIAIAAFDLPRGGQK